MAQRMFNIFLLVAFSIRVLGAGFEDARIFDDSHQKITFKTPQEKKNSGNLGFFLSEDETEEEADIDEVEISSAFHHAFNHKFLASLIVENSLPNLLQNLSYRSVVLHILFRNLRL